MKKKSLLTIFALICVFTLVISSCNFPLMNQPSTQQPGGTTQETGGSTATEAATSVPQGNGIKVDNVYSAGFANYDQKAVSIPEKFTGDYFLPLDLSQVNNLSDYSLTDAQLAALKANGFVIKAPTSNADNIYNEFYQAYESQRYEEQPIFVTTDSIFHVYHLVFDKMLRDLEKDTFIDTLKDLTTTMVIATNTQYQSLKGTPLEDAALRNAAYFSVAASLLGTGDPVLDEAKPYVDAELALINAHQGTDVSPIWLSSDQSQDMQYIEDYSQYIPRGHYTRSPELEAYFKAMMWYGRMNFRLKDSFETQRALLLTQAIRSATSTIGLSALTLWHTIYDPTVFIVGKSDDLGFDEYGKISDAVFGTNPDPQSFADSTKLQTFIDTAKNLPAPQVNSMWVYIWQDQKDVTQGFRLMSQRFTLDQYVFGQVMWRKVGTDDQPRDLPKALDFFAAQGSDLATNLLDQMGETKYANYSTQLDKVKGEVAKLGPDSWTQNLYWTWLYSLQAVTAVKGPQFPVFMQSDAWARKDLQTALSSWTELKHDTILYSKQVMAEMGGGGYETAPKGYVEPNPEAYSRLLALAQMTESGLVSRNILSDTTKGNLDNLISEISFLLDISQKELNNTEISQDEYWQIQYYGGWLEQMTIASADSQDDTEGRNYLEDQKSPVVADVATGMNRVLEEGVGYPTLIYVVTPNQPYQVAVGAVYTYYEFVVDPSQRMTDESWRGSLESGTAPAQPDWTSTFIVP